MLDWCYTFLTMNDHETNSEHNFAHIKAIETQCTSLKSSEQGKFFMFYYSHLYMHRQQMC